VSANRASVWAVPSSLFKELPSKIADKISAILCIALILTFNFVIPAKADSTNVSSVKKVVSSKVIHNQAANTISTTQQIQVAPPPTIQVTVAPVLSQPNTTVIVPTCTPISPSALPTVIDPEVPGLQTQVDSPTTYTVFGDSTDEINAQIAECTPVQSSGTDGFAGRFAASTSNTISWKFGYSEIGPDSCKISYVAVSLHIEQVFPNWQPTSGQNPELTEQWQVFITKLHGYEEGHVTLDEQSAEKILTDLVNFPPTACENISAAGNNLAQLDMDNNLTINTNYDISNDFGNKEGVSL